MEIFLEIHGGKKPDYVLEIVEKNTPLYNKIKSNMPKQITELIKDSEDNLVDVIFMEDSIEEVKKTKLKEIETECEKTMNYGFDWFGTHFTFDTYDQLNLSGSLLSTQFLTGGIPFYNSENCTVYSAEQLASIAVTANYFSVYVLTYWRQLSHQISEIDDIEEVKSIKFKETKLVGEYLDLFNSQLATFDPVEIPYEKFSF